jgi:ankyrin repeat protein
MKGTRRLKKTKRRLKKYNRKRKQSKQRKQMKQRKQSKRNVGKGLKELIEASKVGNVGDVRTQLNAEDNIINAHYHDRRREFGSTPLHVACRNNQVDIIRILLENGADPNSVDDFGQTPLIELMLMDTDNTNINNDVSVAIELLLEHGADINAKDDENDTALMYAVHAKKKTAVDVLLANYPDLHLVDGRGRTVLQIAQEKGDGDIVEAIEEAIAEENVPRLK